MSGIDYLIAKGLVDDKRLGIFGWSYGGYMAAWAITQTSRFKAATIGAGFTDFVSLMRTYDIGAHITNFNSLMRSYDRWMSSLLGALNENTKLYEERSPINHVNNVSTPCLFIHGENDGKNVDGVPISQAYEFYNALNRAGKKAELIIYPGMEHVLSDPKMQLEAMKKNLDWFKQHLIEKP